MFCVGPVVVVSPVDNGRVFSAAPAPASDASAASPLMPVDHVRDVRTEGQTRVEAKWDRVAAAQAAESRSEDDVEADLLTALDLLL